MKKVLIVHGFAGTPNGGWRPWLMGELDRRNVFAYALAMPNPVWPDPKLWLAEIERAVQCHAGDELYFVGHSLGVPALLRYFEGVADSTRSFEGAVLVSGPCGPTSNTGSLPFLERSFEFERIRTAAKRFHVIHGEDDPVVDFSNAHTLAEKLACELVSVPGGGHLNGSSGHYVLPSCLQALEMMMK